jgi:predicted metal-binding membrane protein
VLSSLNRLGPGRDRLVVIAGLAAISGLSWAYMFFLARQMAGMEMAAMPRMQAWTISDLVLTFVMWTVMMVAMMTPSAAPMVLTFANFSQQRHGGKLAPVATFLIGYLLAWTAFSALATLFQWALHEAALMAPATMTAAPVVGGILLLAAGIFQWTPLKHACLSQCRTPIGFLISEWRPGSKGALIMGLRHGRYCLGCCWFLMALLFVAGVMNLLWVAAIALFVLLEKVLPVEKVISYAGGAVFVAWGLWTLFVALAPTSG